MPDPSQMPYLGEGQLGAALAAIQNRGGQINSAVDQASAGQQPVMGQPPPLVQPGGGMRAGVQALGQGLVAGGNNLGGGRPMVTPQQQQQLIQLLRARMAGGQQPPGPPGAMPLSQMPQANPGAVAYAPQQ